MPDGIVDDVVNEISEIATYIKNEVVEGALEVRDFVLEAVRYEVGHIQPQFLKLVADCMAAAEQGLAGHTGAEKYQFAFGNAVAAAEKDGIEFAETLFDDCVQYVIAERNKRRAAKIVADQPNVVDHGTEIPPGTIQEA